MTDEELTKHFIKLLPTYEEHLRRFADDFAAKMKLADDNDIPLMVAFDGCKSHFKLMGDAMLYVAANAQLLVVGGAEA